MNGQPRPERVLNQETRALLDKLAAAGIPEWHTLSVAEARRVFVARAALVATDPEPVAHVEDRLVPGPDGEIPVRIYMPRGTAPFPVFVYFHGGGWALGSRDASDPICRALTNEAGCIVVSVEYRLAPEHRFPAALRDTYAATQWAVAGAATLGGDAAHVTVGGESAGGNLAAAVALMARDRGGPGLAGQLLMYPALDYSFDTPSYRENAEGYFLSRADVMWFWRHYLCDDTDARDPYACPLQASDLRALAPAAIITAEFDPLRDEGEAYAARLRDAGVIVRCARYPGTIHGFMAMAAELDQGRAGIRQAATWLRGVSG